MSKMKILDGELKSGFREKYVYDDKAAIYDFLLKFYYHKKLSIFYGE